MRATRRRFLAGAGAGALAPASLLWAASVPASPQPDREVWLTFLERVSDPVLNALSQHQLRTRMPVEAAPGRREAQASGSPLEAMARLFVGLAPWLELEPDTHETPRETALRRRYRQAALIAIESVVDPASPDYMRFGETAQTLVDSSFLSLALLRAPRQLLGMLTPATKDWLAAALIKERAIQPPFSNWLLFQAMNEALLRSLGAAWDRVRIDYALREHQSWYMGDGTYGDGPHVHADFYNSFVIHPYLLQILDSTADAEPTWKSMADGVKRRAQRQAAIEERMISPAGEYPILGRSITYRAGAFHLLADAARRRILPEPILPAQVRGALTAVQQRTLSAPGTFSPDGWLQIGVAGHQPSLGETYISTGSLYLCSTAWLPLGLSASDPFWSSPPAAWTQKAVWAGEDRPADHALAE